MVQVLEEAGNTRVSEASTGTGWERGTARGWGERSLYTFPICTWPCHDCLFSPLASRLLTHISWSKLLHAMQQYADGNCVAERPEATVTKRASRSERPGGHCSFQEEECFQSTSLGESNPTLALDGMFVCLYFRGRWALDKSSETRLQEPIACDSEGERDAGEDRRVCIGVRRRNINGTDTWPVDTTVMQLVIL